MKYCKLLNENYISILLNVIFFKYNYFCSLGIFVLFLFIDLKSLFLFIELKSFAIFIIIIIKHLLLLENITISNNFKKYIYL